MGGALGVWTAGMVPGVQLAGGLVTAARPDGVVAKEIRGGPDMIRSTWTAKAEAAEAVTPYRLWSEAIAVVSSIYDRLAAAGRYVAPPTDEEAIEAEAEAARRLGDLPGVAEAVVRWREAWLARLR